MAGGTKLLLTSVLLIVFCFAIASSHRHGCRGPKTAFSFPDFKNEDSLAKFTLVGDAQRLESGTLQLSGSAPGTSGSIYLSQPVKLAIAKDLSASFSTFFSFSKGEGLAFVIALSDEAFRGSDRPWRSLAADQNPSAIVVGFDTSTSVDPQLEVSKRVVSVSTSEVLDSERVYAWIDYRSAEKSLEVRVSGSAENRPENPNFSYELDLADMLKDEMFVGFKSFTEENAQKQVIYSWSFVAFGRGGFWRREHGPRGFFGPGSFFGGRGPQDWHKGPHDWHHGPRDWNPAQGFPGRWNPQDMNDEHHGDFHPDHHHGDFHPDHHHGDFHPDHHGDFHPDHHHDHHGDWHPDRDHHGDWHPDHDHHGDWHPDHHHHHDHHDHDHDRNDEAWFGDLSDVWEVILSLLIGAACGSAVAGVVILVWCLIRRCLKKDEDFSAVSEEEKAGLIHGYQKFLYQAAAGADPKGYQKLPSAEKPEGKSDECC